MLFHSINVNLNKCAIYQSGPTVDDICASFTEPVNDREDLLPERHRL